MKQLYPELSVGAICDVFGKSRQAHYKQLKGNEKLVLQQAVIVKLVEEVRSEMPRIGGRKLYHILKNPLLEHDIDIGRDKLFDSLAEFGLLVKKKRRRKPITTDSGHPFFKYPNLIKQTKLHYPNQVWVSDITYIPLIGGFCYLSLITDSYSRKIIGHCLWKNLSRQGALNALTMALNKSAFQRQHSLIHHSDRGLQYCCSEYIQMLQHNKIAISMTANGDPYENAQAERVNGILKSEFGLDKVFKNYETAIDAVNEAIQVYNSVRPHASCNYLTPDQAYELQGPLKKRWKTYKRQTESLKDY